MQEEIKKIREELSKLQQLSKGLTDTGDTRYAEQSLKLTFSSLGGALKWLGTTAYPYAHPGTINSPEQIQDKPIDWVGTNAEEVPNEFVATDALRVGIAAQAELIFGLHQAAAKLENEKGGDTHTKVRLQLGAAYGLAITARDCLGWHLSACKELAKRFEPVGQG